MGDKNRHFINVRFMEKRRRGDCAKMGYVEIKGNELEKYELNQQAEEKIKGLVPNLKVWQELQLKEERDFFAQKLEESEKQYNLQILENTELLQTAKIDQTEFKKRERAALAAKHFFQKKMQESEHDLFILNKNKYDMRRFIPY
ncbi:hypothetical protein IMG5_144240 [Ichthyophthirius multifiliis]|uniref:Uncharacterized protein n=1 Tax=Ichthyophthirius multifiliis TaxID=5932 RepID=G0QXP0_ICHMU|nr:hypothetical protein IMG5_144240 [Ichthyophthirius multifiliis]EGR30021.1 hypothetical protein IMG5_144240 [Ichthyophthirius multifiliis]|eukprot:XP_004031257.1 hypothetical protein IMG5_144240 [Ichthyophthirius multifiliis]